MRSIYVDDVTCGADTEDEAYQLYTVSTKLLAESGFNLRKFVTNSLHLRHRISAEKQKPGHPKPVVATSNVVEENTTYTSTLFKYCIIIRDHEGLGFSGQKYHPKTIITIPSWYLDSID